jgi:hypothetical protein
MSQRSSQRMGDNEPQVGTFWLYGKRLILVGTPLAKAEGYDKYKNFPRGHLHYWAELQRDGSLPRETEYEKPPRGHVLYSTITQELTLMTDRCILRNKRLVSKIMNELSLPENTNVITDSHYRCAKCMEKSRTREQEQKDPDF